MMPSRNEYLRILALTVLFGLLAYAGIVFMRGDGRVAMLWLPNAVAAAWLLRSRTQSIPVYILACLFANVLVNRVIGDPWDTAIGLSIANAAEISALVFLMRKAKGSNPDLAEVDSHVWLTCSAIAGSLLSATIASFVLAAPGQALSMADWQRWIIADSLSLLIILPIVLVLIDEWRNRKKPSQTTIRYWLMMTALVVTGTSLVFAQTIFPFLFLTSPLVLYAAFRTGLLGTAVAMFLITLISSIATTMGLGPITLVRGGSEMQLIAFQTFLAANYSIGFPIAAVLAQRRRDRADLRRERDEKQEVLDNIRDVIFRADSSGCWTSLNPAWEQLTGYTVQESLGAHMTRLTHPDDLAASGEFYTRIVNGEITETTLTQRFFDRSGSIRHIEVGVKRLAAADGSFRGTIGNIRDITDQVRQSQALTESELRFRQLAEAAPVGIFRANADGEITYINRFWAEKVGMTSEQMLGRGWLEAIADPASLEKDPPFQNFTPGETRVRTIEFCGMDGRSVWMQTYNSAEFDKDGVLKGYFGAAVDISEARQLESELRLARVKAEEAANAKSDFLANMSHEIRTPMNGVLGFTELLEHTELDESQRGYVRVIADSGREMMRLLNDILDISKIEAGQLRLAPEPMDLRQKLNGVARLMEAVAAKKNLQVVVEIDPSLPTYIIADPLRLRQVVLNLLGNAIKFTESGTVRLSAEPTSDGRSVNISIADTGIGMSPEDLGSVFQQFTQADGSIARRFGGSGLGLTISKQLVEMMGGDITVTSKPGDGSTFSIIIPLIAAKAPEHADSTRPANYIEANAGVESLRLLIAEDNEINQQLVEAMVRKAGCMPRVVANGEEAISAIIEAEACGEPFAMVLMDFQMPKMDGLSATRVLRALGYDANRLPIIALTANAFPEDIAKCKNAGMQAHIAKPLRMRDLTDAITRFGNNSSRPDAKPRGIDEEASMIPGLAEKYAARKHALRQMLGDITELNIEDRWQELAASLHQLAGIAALFGEESLGEAAASVELSLESASDARTRLALASDALTALHRAA